MKKYFMFFVLAYAIFIVHTLYTKHAIYGDGNGYWVYTQSIFFDNTINSREIIKHLDNFQGRNYIFSRIFWNRDANPFLIGPSLFWIPSQIIISLFSNDRFDLVHELGPGITGIVLMLLGLIFLEKYLSKKFKKTDVNFTILTLFFGSNIFYYTTFEPALSHQPAFFIVSYLLYLTISKKKNFFIIGFLTGILAITRVADTALVIPIIYLMKPKVKQVFKLMFGFIIGIIPQLYLQYYFYKNIFINPYLNGVSGKWSINFYHLFEYLISWKRGLFFWSPLALFGIVGLFKQKKHLILTTIFILFFIHSSWSAYLSAGFGQRFAFAMMPYFAIGICYILQKFSHRKKIFIFLYFTYWNILLILGFYLLKLKDVT